MQDPSFELPMSAASGAEEPQVPEDHTSQPEYEPAQPQQSSQATENVPASRPVQSSGTSLSMLPGVNAVLQAGVCRFPNMDMLWDDCIASE